MSEEMKLRKVWEGDLKCAYCNEPNHVKIQKEIVVPAEPAETRIVVQVERSVQRTLEDSTE